MKYKVPKKNEQQPKLSEPQMSRFVHCLAWLHSACVMTDHQGAIVNKDKPGAHEIVGDMYFMNWSWSFFYLTDAVRAEYGPDPEFVKFAVTTAVRLRLVPPDSEDDYLNVVTPLSAFEILQERNLPRQELSDTVGIIEELYKQGRS